ncbi:MAG TPA: hypothetical protein VF210_14610 [Pseudomonadales bacterium]
MNRTLPLFHDLEPDGGRSQTRETPEAGASVPASARADGGAGPRDAAAAARDRHLRAAWRLSRRMKKFREGSPEQTRAGLEICRHLQALLKQDSAA